MPIKRIIGFAILASLALVLMWRAAREGHLKALLQGALYGLGIAVLMMTAMRLISEG